jgi:hypothetical protein
MFLQAKLNWIALLAVFLLTACAQSSKNYYDISELEKPPQLEIVPAKAESSLQTEADAEKKGESGLKDAVKLENDSELQIKLTFDQTWKLLATALKLSDIEVTDLDHEKGQYYVLFDPDNADTKKGESENFLTAFFSANSYPQGRYLLTLTEKEHEIIVRAEFLEYLTEHSSQDGYADATPSEKGVAMLMKKLYNTLHDELHLE